MGLQTVSVLPRSGDHTPRAHLPPRLGRRDWPWLSVGGGRSARQCEHASHTTFLVSGTKKSDVVRRKTFREKKTPTQPFHFPIAVSKFWLQKLSFPWNKRALSPPSAFSLLQPGTQAGGSPPLGGWHVSSHKSLSWQPLLRKPALSRTSPVTKDNVAKPEPHSVPQRDRGLSLFWCQLAGLVVRSPVEQMWPGYIMQIGCSEELISECLWTSLKTRGDRTCVTSPNTVFFKKKKAEKRKPTHSHWSPVPASASPRVNCPFMLGGTVHFQAENRKERDENSRLSPSLGLCWDWVPVPPSGRTSAPISS